MRLRLNRRTRLEPLDAFFPSFSLRSNPVTTTVGLPLPSDTPSFSLEDSTILTQLAALPLTVLALDGSECADMLECTARSAAEKTGEVIVSVVTAAGSGGDFPV